MRAAGAFLMLAVLLASVAFAAVPASAEAQDDDSLLTFLDLGADDAALRTYRLLAGSPVSISDYVDDSVSCFVESISEGSGLSKEGGVVTGLISEGVSVLSMLRSVGDDCDEVECRLVGVPAAPAKALGAQPSEASPAAFISYMDGTSLVGTQSVQAEEMSKVRISQPSGLSKDGHYLKGWTVRGDDSGTVYRNGDRIEISGDTVLDAVWEEGYDLASIAVWAIMMAGILAIIVGVFVHPALIAVGAVAAVYAALELLGVVNLIRGMT